MSRSLYLVCHATRQIVHVAESGGGGHLFRGANYSVLVGAFCEAHYGKELVTMGEQGVDDAGGARKHGEFNPYDEWEPHNFEALLRVVMDTGNRTDDFVRAIQESLA